MSAISPNAAGIEFDLADLVGFHVLEVLLGLLRCCSYSLAMPCPICLLSFIPIIVNNHNFGHHGFGLHRKLSI